jgi:hypothetical protein
LLSTGVGPESRPRAVERTEFLDPSADTLERRLAGIDGLALSPDPGVAVLLRSAFWRAAGSSAAALVATLRRYRRLLLHARDAAAAGQQPTRQALLRLTAGLSDQLLMWQLLPEAAGALELIADDLPRVDELIADLVKELGRDDLKVARLRLLLADGRSTIVFTVSRETVRWLRDRLGCRVAWCTGQHAGVGMTRTSRQTVLSWFGADAPARRGLLGGRFAPAHLVSTDVAAEGLDLQGAERVVHYDLPWTPMRLEQRRGRIVRAGSCHPDVEIVRFDPPAPLERRLKHAELLLRKARLPAMVGLGEAAESWRWRGALAAGFEDIVAARGVAAIAAEPAGVLAGFTVHPWPDSGRAPLAAHVLWWTEECGWTDAPTTIKQRLALAASVAPAPVERAPCRWALEQLGRVVRDHVRTIRRASWELPAPSPPARALLSRLDLLARAAARQRHSATLAQIQRAIAFAAGGHTAGERREVERLAGLGDPELTAALPRVPGPTAIPAVLQARVTGVILFLGAATFPRCRPTTRSSLTSTER